MLGMLLMTHFHRGWRFWPGAGVRVSAEAVHAGGGDALVPGAGAAAWSKGIL